MYGGRRQNRPAAATVCGMCGKDAHLPLARLREIQKDRVVTTSSTPFFIDGSSYAAPLMAAVVRSSQHKATSMHLR